MSQPVLIEPLRPTRAPPSPPHGGGGGGSRSVLLMKKSAFTNWPLVDGKFCEYCHTQKRLVHFAPDHFEPTCVCCALDTTPPNSFHQATTISKPLSSFATVSDDGDSVASVEERHYHSNSDTIPDDEQNNRAFFDFDDDDAVDNNNNEHARACTLASIGHSSDAVQHKKDLRPPLAATSKSGPEQKTDFH
jgi:hypothetical protein